MSTKNRTFETFRPFDNYDEQRATSDKPFCWNGAVSVRKYRVTVELVDEPTEVLAERLRKLWSECDNHHHYSPLKAVAKQLGIDLESGELGKERKDRK